MNEDFAMGEKTTSELVASFIESARFCYGEELSAQMITLVGNEFGCTVAELKLDFVQTNDLLSRLYSLATKQALYEATLAFTST